MFSQQCICAKDITAASILFPSSGDFISYLELVRAIFFRSKDQVFLDVLFLRRQLHVANMLTVNNTAKVVTFIFERDKSSLIIVQIILRNDVQS